MGDRKGSESQRVSWNLPGVGGCHPGTDVSSTVWCGGALGGHGHHQCPASSDPSLPKMGNHLCARPELLMRPGKQGLDLSFMEEKRLLALPWGARVLAVTVGWVSLCPQCRGPLPRPGSSIILKSVCPKPTRVDQIETKPKHRKWQGCLGIALLLGAWNGVASGDSSEVLH